MLRSGRDISVRLRTHNFFTILKFITLIGLSRTGKWSEMERSEWFPALPGQDWHQGIECVSGRSEVYVFDCWCHLGTVDHEADLDHVLGTKHFMGVKGSMIC